MVKKGQGKTMDGESAWAVELVERSSNSLSQYFDHARSIGIVMGSKKDVTKHLVELAGKEFEIHTLTYREWLKKVRDGKGKDFHCYNYKYNQKREDYVEVSGDGIYCARRFPLLNIERILKINS